MALYLVDGHALAYRSYYAFAGRPLTNSRGEETSAIYGFLSTLLALIDRFDPPHLAVVFDAPGPNFRHEMFEQYKANREAMPDSLRGQLPVIMALLESMRIPHVALPGYEADDIIATMARQWSERTPVEIVSGDKDLFQLIDERVHVIRPARGGVLEDEMDAAALEARLGLRPDQIVDFLALTGDSSDNIPGVRGVGEKTARKLLQQFDTLDGIYANISRVAPPGVKKKLKAGEESARLSRTLVLLKSDVPLEVDLDDFEREDHFTDEFFSLLSDLEFDRLTEQLRKKQRDAGGSPARAERTTERAPDPQPDGDSQPARAERESAEAATEPTREPQWSQPEQFYEPPPETDWYTERAERESGDQPQTSYTAITTEPELRTLCQRLDGLDEIAIDVETSGLDPMRAVLAGISVATKPGTAYYIPVTSDIEGEGLSLFNAPAAPGLPLDVVRMHLSQMLSAPRPTKVGQNIKYDEIVLRQAGMPLSGISFDTMLASYCLDPARRSHGLDALAQELCGHEMIPFGALFDKRTREKDIRLVPLEQVTQYACEDADYTLRIKQAFAPMIAASPARGLFEDVEMPLRDVLARMEMTGVRIDLDFLAGMSERYGERLQQLERDIYEAAGERFNINSTRKLREVLFDRLGLKPGRKTKTGYSTDVDVLTGMSGDHPVVPLLLEYRQLVKLKNTYIDALPRLVHPDTGRVHTSYNQAVATTGRLSSSEPNLQNIPIRTVEGREIRKAFVPEDRHILLDADYSQIELRILAHLSGDEGLISAFRNDGDVHRATAARILGVFPEDVTDDMRSRAKTVNFGIIYGMGARGLANSLEIDVEEARKFIDDYFRTYPGVKRFIDDTIARAREDGVTTTMLGRMRRLEDIGSSNNRARAFSERIAVNTPVQGTAADIIKLAMLEVDRRMHEENLRSRMILQVHDELLFEVHEREVDRMEALVRECMEGAVALDVPLKVDMGKGANWFEAH